ncbi:MAG: hypothetical protein ACK5JU_00345, partial [Bacteroidales bacterium]
MGGKVIGAFPSNKQLKHRRFNEEVKQITTKNLTSFLNGYFKPETPMVINLLSIEETEGKSVVLNYRAGSWRETGVNVQTLSQEDLLIPESKALGPATR